MVATALESVEFQKNPIQFIDSVAILTAWITNAQ